MTKNQYSKKQEEDHQLMSLEIFVFRVSDEEERNFISNENKKNIKQLKQIMKECK